MQEAEISLGSVAVSRPAENHWDGRKQAGRFAVWRRARAGWWHHRYHGHLRPTRDATEDRDSAAEGLGLLVRSGIGGNAPPIRISLFAGTVMQDGFWLTICRRCRLFSGCSEIRRGRDCPGGYYSALPRPETPAREVVKRITGDGIRCTGALQSRFLSVRTRQHALEKQL
jgi:hypothetical protein